GLPSNSETVAVDSPIPETNTWLVSTATPFAHADVVALDDSDSADRSGALVSTTPSSASTSAQPGAPAPSAQPQQPPVAATPPGPAAPLGFTPTPYATFSSNEFTRTLTSVFAASSASRFSR